MVATATIGIAKILHDATGHEIPPMTGYQHTKKGSEYMDNTMSLLRQKKEGSENYVIRADERLNFIDKHES
jgi:hypothetical protein